MPQLPVTHIISALSNLLGSASHQPCQICMAQSVSIQPSQIWWRGRFNSAPPNLYGATGSAPNLYGNSAPPNLLGQRTSIQPSQIYVARPLQFSPAKFARPKRVTVSPSKFARRAHINPPHVRPAKFAGPGHVNSPRVGPPLCLVGIDAAISHASSATGRVSQSQPVRRCMAKFVVRLPLDFTFKLDSSVEDES